MFERISHYKVLSRLGAGGMGEVWRAIDERLGRDVAIKLLARKGASADRALRMMREAQAASALNHPGIVTIHDVGEHEGQPYVVMELVEGRRFSELGRLPPREALELCALAADALGAAHERGILHRDVKSDNLMRLPDGRVKVLDFGLAKVVGGSIASPSHLTGPRRPPANVSPTAQTVDSGDRTPIPPPEAPGAVDTVDIAGQTLDTGPRVRTPSDDLTRHGEIVGTPAYMAPEQARGEAADARSEVFSLGVVLYELLCGRRPFLARDVEEQLEVIRRAQHTSPSVATESPELAPYDRLVAACLAKDPAARPANMRTLAKLLREAAAPPRRRTRAPLIAGAAVLAVAAGGLAVWRMRSHDAPAGSPKADRIAGANGRRVTLDEGCEEMPSVSRDGKLLVFDAAHGADYVLESLDANHKRRTLTTGPGWDIAPTISPDGTQIAFLRKRQGPYEAVVTDIGFTHEPRSIEFGGMRPAWSPDGKALWAGSGLHPTRFAVATAKPERTVTPPAGLVALAVLELDDGSLAGLMFKPDTGTYPVGLALFPPKGEMRWLYQGELDEVLLLAADRRGIVVSKVLDQNREIVEVPLVGGEPISLRAPAINAHKGLTTTPDWSLIAWSDCTDHIDAALAQPQGNDHRFVPLTSGTWADIDPVAVGTRRQLVVISDRSSEVRPWLIDLDGAQQTKPIVDAEPTQIAVSYDGATLLYTTEDGGIWQAPMDGSAPPRQLGLVPGASHAAFGAGDVIYFEVDADTGPRIFTLAGGKSTALLPESSALPAPSPDGKLLVYAKGGGGVRSLVVRDLGTGVEHSLAIDLPGGHWTSVRYSSDGTRVACVLDQSEVFVVDPANRKIVDHVIGRSRSFAGATMLGSDIVVGENWWRGDIWVDER